MRAMSSRSPGGVFQDRLGCRHRAGERAKTQRRKRKSTRIHSDREIHSAGLVDCSDLDLADDHRGQLGGHQYCCSAKGMQFTE